jgi:diguanylate cyclase (GGDEF)-like protein
MSTERRDWPWLFLGGLVANVASDVLLHDKTVLVSLAFASGNAMEAFAGAWMLLRFAGAPFMLNRVSKVLALAILAAVLSTTLSATVGATVVSAVLNGASWLAAWLTWWSTDAAGILIVTPVLLALADRRFLTGLSDSPRRALELSLLLAGSIGVTVYVFGQPPSSLTNRPVLLLPLLLWAAIRFGPQGAALALLIPSLIITWNTAQGVGPFAPPGTGAAQQQIATQVALCVMSISTLLLATIVAERRDATEALRESEKYLLQANRELQSLKEALMRQSLVDPLTELANRRAIDKKLSEVQAQWQRRQRPYSVVMVDVDHFKSFNDILGHTEGDRCLQTLARTFSTTTRMGDLVGRWGGEEFIVILPETDSKGASAFCARLHESVADLGLPHPASSLGGIVTVSAGIASYHGEPGVDSRNVVEAADRALYQAKQRGRNRTEVATLAIPGPSGPD